MIRTGFLAGAILGLALIASSCGDSRRLESIKAVPVDPTIFNNNTVYVTPGGVVQYQIQGWYTNNTVATAIPSSDGHWSSTQPGIASVDSNGVVTSAGPVGVTTIEVTFDGHRGATTFAVCTLSSLCPPVCDPTSCP